MFLSLRLRQRNHISPGSDSPSSPCPLLPWPYYSPFACRISYCPLHMAWPPSSPLGVSRQHVVNGFLFVSFSGFDGWSGAGPPFSYSLFPYIAVASMCPSLLAGFHRSSLGSSFVCRSEGTARHLHVVRLLSFLPPSLSPGPLSPSSIPEPLAIAPPLSFFFSFSNQKVPFTLPDSYCPPVDLVRKITSPRCGFRRENFFRRRDRLLVFSSLFGSEIVPPGNSLRAFFFAHAAPIVAIFFPRRDDNIPSVPRLPGSSSHLFSPLFFSERLDDPAYCPLKATPRFFSSAPKTTAVVSSRTVFF